MELIYQLIAEKELDAEQEALYRCYADWPAFREIISTYSYYKIPHVLDCFRLQEAQLGTWQPSITYAGNWRAANAMPMPYSWPFFDFWRKPEDK